MKNKKMSLICIGLLLLMQTGMMFYFADRKYGYFVDEICSYEAANYDEAVQGTNGLIWHNTMEQWKEGSFFTDALTAGVENRFDFSTAYHNQENDAHPPIYHFIIHFMSSLFPGVLSKWIGIIPNMIFCMLTTVFLFFIVAEIFEDCKVAFAVDACWALSIGAMTASVFIRMYALLTFACVLFVWMHMRLAEKICGSERVTAYLPLVAVTVLGMLTQYYFLIFAFFFCAVFTFFLYVHKNYRSCMRYMTCELSAVFGGSLLFPEMWHQIFGGERGGEAFFNLIGSENYIEHFKDVASIISRNLFNGWGKEITVAIIGILIISWWKKIKNSVFIKPQMNLHTLMEWFKNKKNVLFAATGTATGMYILVVIRIAPYIADRYYMCIYPFVVMFVISGIYKALYFVTDCKKISCAALLSFAIIMIFVSHLTQTVSYVGEEYKERVDILNIYRDKPVILLNGLDFDSATDIYVFEYQYQKAVFRCLHGAYSGLKKAAETYDLSSGFLLYAYWQRELGMMEENIFEKVEEYLPIAEYKLIIEEGCPVYYCMPDDGRT